jgi:hypothetical protein
MRASLRLNCSTPWPPNPLHRQGQLLLHDPLSKICDKTGSEPKMFIDNASHPKWIKSS